MRIGELSRRAGVPVPTTKYYLREGLLPAGERMHANQVSYADEHVQRLRLIRTMVEVGRFPIATVREVLGELDSGERDLDGLLGVLSRTIAAEQADRVRHSSDDTGLRAAQELTGRHGLPDDPAIPYLREIADVLTAFESLGQADLAARIADTYAEAAKQVAAVDIEAISGLDRENTAVAMITGTVLGEALFAALRRLAQAQLSIRTFSDRGDS